MYKYQLWELDEHMKKKRQNRYLQQFLAVLLQMLVMVVAVNLPLNINENFVLPHPQLHVNNYFN